MTLATSQGCAARPNGSAAASSASRSSLVTLARNGWTARLGATALTRMPWAATSSAAHRVRAITPALAAA
jgi:hypothetical protein